jgi:hypothetical protein
MAIYRNHYKMTTDGYREVEAESEEKAKQKFANNECEYFSDDNIDAEYEYSEEILKEI